MGKFAFTIHHHPDHDEYAVPAGYKTPSGKEGHYFTNDKDDAVATAKTLHKGKDLDIKFRSKRYGPEFGND